jgi:hypothetical protein
MTMPDDQEFDPATMTIKEAMTLIERLGYEVHPTLSGQFRVDKIGGASTLAATLTDAVRLVLRLSRAPTEQPGISGHLHVRLNLDLPAFANLPSRRVGGVLERVAAQVMLTNTFAGTVLSDSGDTLARYWLEHEGDAP